MTDSDHLVTTAQLARRLHLKPQTLRKWRCTGQGPRFVRLGPPRRGRVVYSMQDVQHWLASRAFRSTSEEQARGANTEGGGRGHA